MSVMKETDKLEMKKNWRTKLKKVLEDIDILKEKDNCDIHIEIIQGGIRSVEKQHKKIRIQ